MIKDLGDQQPNMSEAINSGTHFVIVRNWDGSIGILEQQIKLEGMVKQMGFDLATLAATLNRKFPDDLPSHVEHNKAGEKTEDVVLETIIVNNRPLDRLLVTAYPPAAKPNPPEMTKFKSGGEVILVTDGEAEITFALGAVSGSISKFNLKTEKVRKGDLIVSTDTPNNWTKVYGDKFSFIYFVGNPNGPQKYKDIPKENIQVK